MPAAWLFCLTLYEAHLLVAFTMTKLEESRRVAHGAAIPLYAGLCAIDFIIITFR